MRDDLHIQPKGELTEEACYLHASMFGTLPSNQFIKHYVAANQNCPDLHGDQVEIDLIQQMISNKVNALALESAFRLLEKRHLLTRKMILISYIAECDGMHLQLYNGDDSNLHFWWKLPWRCTQAIVRMILGKISVARYGF